MVQSWKIAQKVQFCEINRVWTMFDTLLYTSGHLMNEYTQNMNKQFFLKFRGRFVSVFLSLFFQKKCRCLKQFQVFEKLKKFWSLFLLYSKLPPPPTDWRFCVRHRTLASVQFKHWRHPTPKNPPPPEWGRQPWRLSDLSTVADSP